MTPPGMAYHQRVPRMHGEPGWIVGTYTPSSSPIYFKYGQGKRRDATRRGDASIRTCMY